MRSRFQFTPSVLCTFVLVVCAALLIVVGRVSAQVAPSECRDAAGAPVPCTPTPAPDRDSDGVPDARDACPDQPGAPGGNGCPASNEPTATPVTPTLSVTLPPPAVEATATVSMMQTTAARRRQARRG